MHGAGRARGIEIRNQVSPDPIRIDQVCNRGFLIGVAAGRLADVLRASSDRTGNGIRLNGIENIPSSPKMRLHTG